MKNERKENEKRTEGTHFENLKGEEDGRRKEKETR